MHTITSRFCLTICVGTDCLELCELLESAPPLTEARQTCLGICVVSGILRVSHSQIASEGADRSALLQFHVASADDSERCAGTEAGVPLGGIVICEHGKQVAELHERRW